MLFSSMLRSLRPPWARTGRQTRQQAPQRRGLRLTVEQLEDRLVLSNFTAATVSDLIADINAANLAGGSNTITLVAGNTFTLTAVDNTTDGATGLPVIAANDNLTILGNGDPIARSTAAGTPAFRLLDVTGGASLTLKNLRLQGGLALGSGVSAEGGAIYSQGTLTLTGCFLDHDSANAGDGGGIFNAGTAQLTKCTLYLDSASNYGAGIMNQTGGTLTLTQCTLGDGTAGNAGGGIFNQTGGTLTLTQCTLSNDTAVGSAGGIYNSGTATLTNCTFSNDTALSGGSGGIGNVGTLTLTLCTLSNDTSAIEGGGIDNFSGTATLTNCTLSNDTSPFGGGINNFGTATLTNCTLSNNSASQGGGIFTSGTLNLTNTIVAGNTATSGGLDIFGAVTTADHNLVGDATGSSGISNGVGGNIVGGNGNPVIDARLGPLQNNGGSTETMALLPDSPAIGHADNAAAPATDQRGIIRIDEAGETTDIGAFEL